MQWVLAWQLGHNSGRVWWDRSDSDYHELSCTFFKFLWKQCPILVRQNGEAPVAREAVQGSQVFHFWPGKCLQCVSCRHTLVWTLGSSLCLWTFMGLYERTAAMGISFQDRARRRFWIRSSACASGGGRWFWRFRNVEPAFLRPFLQMYLTSHLPDIMVSSSTLKASPLIVFFKKLVKWGKLSEYGFQ